jgi:hypothetical protein
VSALTLRSIAIIAALLSTSCSSSSSDLAASAGRPGKFSEIYPLIFPATTRAQCNFCHSLPPNLKSNGKLSMGMDKATAYQALVGKSSLSTNCAGRTLVVPGEPDSSLFLQKVTASPPCGDHMPLGGDPLPVDQVEMIRSWIAAGAMDD